MTVYRQTFNGGELTPELLWRADLARYQNSCRTIENFLVTPFGAVKRRAGTMQMHVVPSPYRDANQVPDGRARIFSFSYGDGDAVICVVYRRWDQGTATDSVRLVLYDYYRAQRYDVAAPWPAASLNDLRAMQVNDVVWFCHPTTSPRKLSRLSDTSWTFTEQAFSGGPFMDEEEHALGVTFSGTPSGSGVYSGDVTISCASVLFDSTWIGKRMKFQAGAPQFTAITWASGATVPGNSAHLHCELGSSVKVTTGGTWAGELVLQSLEPGATEWRDVATITSSVDAPENFTIERDIEGVGVWVGMYLRARSAATGDNGVKVTLRVVTPTALLGKIKAVAGNGKSATLTLDYGVTALPSGTVKTWAEGHFSDANGWPVCCAVYQERLVFGGTTRRPQSLFFSTLNDWENFAPGSLATSPMTLTIAADRLNAIQWLCANKRLLIGTDSGEWSLSELNSSEAVGPANVKVERQTEYGSAPIDAMSSADLVVFVQRGGTRLRSVSYDYTTDGFTAPDLSLLSKHMLEDGVSSLAFQRTPDPVLWVTTYTGNLVSLSYDRENQVVGWARHPLSVDAKILGVTVCRQSASGRDDVWLLVQCGADLVTAVMSVAETADLSAWMTAYAAGAKCPFPGAGAGGLVPRLRGHYVADTTGANAVEGVDYVSLTGTVWYVHTAGTDSAPVAIAKDLDNVEGLGNISSKFRLLDAGDGPWLSNFGCLIQILPDCPADWNKVLVLDADGQWALRSVEDGTFSVYDLSRCAWVMSYFAPVSWKLAGTTVPATARKTLGATAMGSWTLLFNADSKVLTVQDGSGDVTEGLSQAGNISWFQSRPYAGMMKLTASTSALVLDAGITAVLRPMPFAAMDGQHGKVARINAVRLFVLDAAGLEVSLDGGITWELVPTLTANVNLWSPWVPGGQSVELAAVPRFSGQVRIPLTGGSLEEADVMVRNATDYPSTICAIGLELQRLEK